MYRAFNKLFLAINLGFPNFIVFKFKIVYISKVDILSISVGVVRNKPGYFAQKLYKSMKVRENKEILTHYVHNPCSYLMALFLPVQIQNFMFNLMYRNKSFHAQNTGFPQALKIMENLENHFKKSYIHGKIMEFEKNPE